MIRLTTDFFPLSHVENVNIAVRISSGQTFSIFGNSNRSYAMVVFLLYLALFLRRVLFAQEMNSSFLVSYDDRLSHLRVRYDFSFITIK